MNKIQNHIVVAAANAIEHVFSEKNSLAKAFFNEKSKDELWLFRYGEFVKTAEDIYDFKTFFTNVFESNPRDKKVFIRKFCKRVLKANLFAYVVAEILKPLATIIVKRIKTTSGRESALLFVKTLKMDIKTYADIARAETEKIFQNKRKHITYKTLQCIGFADADFYLNRLTPFLSTLKQIKIHSQNKATDRLAKRIDLINIGEIDMLMAEMESACNRFAGYKYRTPVLRSGHIEFLFTYIFARSIKKLSFSVRNISPETIFFAEEIKLTEAIYCLLINAIEARATNMYIVINDNGLEIENNGDKMLNLEKNACLKRFFSGKGKAGIGLSIAKELLEGFGGDLVLGEQEKFKIILKRSNK